MPRDIKDTARRLYEEMWNAGRLELVDALFDPGFVGHDPLAGEQDRERFRQMVAGYRTAFPDLHFEVEELRGDEETVTVRWTAHGTHRGPLFGMDPTGRAATVSGISFSHFRNGRLVEDWVSWDTLGLFQQLGILPALQVGGARTAEDEEAAPGSPS